MDYTTLTDDELVKYSRENDSIARNTLIARYTNAVYKVARPLYLEGGELGDLIVEGMLGINKAIDSFNFKTPFINYAFLCIKSSIYSLIKKANCKKNKALSNYVSISGVNNDDDADKNGIMKANDFNPEQELINNESEKELNELIRDSLSKFEKEILELYLQGFTYGSISEKVGKNLKSIDNTIQRVRRKLEEKLGKKKEK